MADPDERACFALIGSAREARSTRRQANFCGADMCMATLLDEMIARIMQHGHVAVPSYTRPMTLPEQQRAAVASLTPHRAAAYHPHTAYIDAFIGSLVTGAFRARRLAAIHHHAARTGGRQKPHPRHLTVACADMQATWRGARHGR